MMASRPASTKEQIDAADPGHSVWVAANAGSGKTHVLIDRVIRLLLAGAAAQSILCLTFTKAAAAEMSTRLFERLAGWVALADADLSAELSGIGVSAITPAKLVQARRLFAQAIETPGGLKIQTIHGFCEKLLQLFPVEAGIAPGFRVMDDTQKNELLRLACDTVLANASREDGADLLSLLDDGVFSGRRLFEDLVGKMLSGRSGMRDILTGEADVDAFGLVLGNALGLPQSSTLAAIEGEIGGIDRVAYLSSALKLTGKDMLRGHDVPELLRQAASATSAKDLSTALVKLFFTLEKEERKELLLKGTRLELADAAAWLATEKTRIVDHLTDHAHATKIQATLALYRLMRRIAATFLRAKQARGLYDFDDLIARAAQLLSSSRATQWVLYKLDSGLSHILVDEAQDTSPPQWHIISALSGEFFAGTGQDDKGRRTVFAVGDRKQSIFSFQGADTAAFEDARNNLNQKSSGAGHPSLEINLAVSYRSTPEILQAVDVVFARGSRARTGFGTNAADERDHVTNRKNARGRFEIWPLIAPTGGGEPDPWDVPVDHIPSDAPRRRLARHIAEIIRGWIGKRQLASQNRAVEAGDILVLMQRRGSLFQALISELRIAGVTVAGADRLRLHESLVIQDLVALSQFIQIADDDLSLACVLKSPLLGQPLSEDELYEVAHGRNGQSLWNRLRALEKFTGQRHELEGYAALAGIVGPYEFFAHVITASRKRILARLGVEAGEASNAFLDLAMTYEREHNSSLAGFINWFLRSEQEVKRELEQASGDVRIMTVHGAKGLEANIVILPDAADGPGRTDTSNLIAIPDGLPEAGLILFDLATPVKSDVIKAWKAAATLKSKEERKRLLYVAMTRARDELYVCGSRNRNNPPADCWYNLVDEAFKQNGSINLLSSIAVGEPLGTVLRLGDDDIADTVSQAKAAAAPDLPPWITQKWVNQKPPRRDDSSLGMGATTAPADGNGGAIDARAAARGTAIHRLLETLPAISTDKRVESALHLAKIHGLSEEIALALVNLIERDDLAPLFAANSQAEVSVLGQVESYGLVQGRIDRLAVASDTILMLDYKSGTLQPRGITAEHPYARQMALYVAVLEQAYPGRKVRAALLWTQSGAVEWLDNALLSRALERENGPPDEA